MLRLRAGLTDLQRDLLESLLKRGPAKRMKGGYGWLGAKPFTVRAVQMMEREGFVSLPPDRTTASITLLGGQLMVQGVVEVPDERLAG